MYVSFQVIFLFL